METMVLLADMVDDDNDDCFRNHVFSHADNFVNIHQSFIQNNKTMQTDSATFIVYIYPFVYRSNSK